MSEQYRRWSPYNYTVDNPIRFIDPDGKGVNDIIHTNKEGYITKVEEAKGPDKVVNENGEELKFNDQGFDQTQLESIIGEKAVRYSINWREEGVRLFTTFTNKEMANSLNSVEIGKLKRFMDSNPGTIENNFVKAIFVANLGHSEFDFADDMASVSREGGNANPAKGVFPDDGTGGFIKMENSNTLYNIYDAGNFLTGKAMSMIGVSIKSVLGGASLNNMVSSRSGSSILDSDADQQALGAGYNYSGVVWNKK